MNKRFLYAFSGVMILLVSGMVYAWSVFSSSIAVEYPDWSRASLSLVFTFVMLFFCIGGLIGGFIPAKVKPTWSILASAVFFLIGFQLSSRAQSPTALCFGFGFFCGIGASLSYNGVISSISKWFPDSQGLISGVLLMGFGFSSFIFGKVFQSMSVSFSWRDSFQLLGLVSSVILAFFAFFIRRPETSALVEKRSEGARNFSPCEMVRTPAFYVFFIWAVLMSAAGLSLVSQASGIAAASSNASPDTIATLVGMISISNGLGRVLFGMLYDRKGCNVVLQSIHVSMVASSIFLCLATRMQSIFLLVVGFIVGGLGYGGITCTNSAYVSSTFGMRNYPRNFPIMTMNLLFASFGSTIAGALLDSTNSYYSIYLLIGGLTAAGFLLSFVIAKSRRNLLNGE